VMYLFFMGFAVAALIAFSLWAVRDSVEGPSLDKLSPSEADEFPRNARYLPLIRQALSREDIHYLQARAPVAVVGQARRDRKRVALAHLRALRCEFRRLLTLARVIAALSPEVTATDELERLRLTAQFAWRFELVALRIRWNFAPLPELRNITEMVSALSVRLEAAIKELGERAALAGEIASSLDRRGLDSVG